MLDRLTRPIGRAIFTTLIESLHNHLMRARRRSRKRSGRDFVAGAE